MQTQYVTCPNCRSQNVSNTGRCSSCGSALPVGPFGPMQPVAPPGAKLPGAEKKLAAGICGIVLGGLGVHKFILGYQNEGITMLAVYLIGIVSSFFTCGLGGLVALGVHVVGIVEGIMYLTKSDEEFVQTYVANKKPWF